MTYLDVRDGLTIETPKGDGVFVWSFCDDATVDAENDDREWQNLQEMASPQFGGIVRRCDTASLLKITDEVLAEQRDFWEQDYDWSTAVWDFHGWRMSDYGRPNLIATLSVDGDVHGMLVVQHASVD